MMGSLIYVLLYLSITIIETLLMLRKKEKKQSIVYVIVILIPLTLSISIVKGTNIPSLASVIRNLLLPLISQIQEIGK